MTDGQSYSFAAGIFGRERVFRLGADSLDWEDGRSSGSIVYAEVESVHMYSMFAPYGPGTQVCIIRTRSGVRCVLKSRSFQSWGRSEDRGIRYVPFVRDLLDRISTAAPQPRIFDGLPISAYYGRVVVLAGVAVLIIAEFAQVIVDWRTGSDGAATSVILMGVLIPPAISLAKNVFRGSRRRLNSENLQEELQGLGLS